MVRHNFESTLVVDVKSKQHLDPLLTHLKESVLKKIMNISPKGRMRYLGTKEYYVYHMWVV